MLDSSLILSALIGVAGGLFAGYVIEHYRLKHELKTEKIKRLAPYLEQIYPTLKDLNIDSNYAVELAERGSEEASLSERLCVGLKEFESWYSMFRRNGLEPELESLNEDLCNFLRGIFTYAQMSEKYGAVYVSQRLHVFHGLCLSCRSSLESLLKG